MIGNNNNRLMNKGPYKFIKRAELMNIRNINLFLIQEIIKH